MPYFVFLPAATAQTEFDDDFKKAETSGQLETLLKKYPAEGEKIIPKLESTIINEILISKGTGNRFLIKEIMPRPGLPGSLTIKGTGKGYMELSMEFPRDQIPISIGMGGGGSNLPLASGSIHRFAGEEVKFEVDGVYAFVGEGDKLNRLTFGLIKDSGYVYLRGKGKVILKDGKKIALGYDSQEILSKEQIDKDTKNTKIENIADKQGTKTLVGKIISIDSKLGDIVVQSDERKIKIGDIYHYFGEVSENLSVTMSGVDFSARIKNFKYFQIGDKVEVVYKEGHQEIISIKKIQKKTK